MAKSTKNKFLSFLNLLILFALFCCLNGCGNKEGEITPTTGTGRQIAAFTGSPTSLAAGNNSILAVKVTDSSGGAVSGATVAFDFVTNTSGATITTMNGGKTDAGGQALALYTAGATNPTADVQDTIQASVAGATGIVIITRTSSSTSSTGHQIYLIASTTSLAAGESSIITATVRDGSGNPASGQAVTFTILSNNSGAPPLTILGLGVTDAGGQTAATYTAGANNPNTNVQDMIQASVTGSTDAVIITRTASSGTGPGTTSNGTLTLSVSSSVVTFGTPVTVTATLKDANGALVPNAVVTFAASNSLVSFTPTSATALTNASGVASITLDAASIDSAGATYITASAPVTTEGITSTITSTPVGIAVNGAAITLGALTLGQPSISSYGTSSVSVPVLIGGSPATVPISVTFTSACVSAGKATLSSPVTSNAVTGIANSTYKDNNCNSGTDLITASVIGGATASATITVVPPAASNIKFISAIPEIIGTSTASAPSLSKSSVVKFQVVDSSNNGKSGVLVDFSLLPASAPGGITFSPASATSDTDGYVTTTLTSGTVPTPVWVVAYLDSDHTIRSQSNTLTITTGLPTQNFFSLSASTHNIEGWSWDGITSALMIIASDRLGNPVPDGTAINFITEGAQITPASCTTTGGTCTVTFKSSQYKPIDETTTVNPNGAVAAVEYDGITPITIDGGPDLFVQNGRVTILAYAVGEKSFVDSNNNNSYDSGETFYDLGDLYLDSNENRIWDSNTTQPNLVEQYINYEPVASPVACQTHIGGGGTAPLPNNYWTSPSKENTCSGVWGLNYVRRSQTIILSGSSPKISQHTFNMASSCTNTFSFWLMDSNNNPMPAGTTVTTDSSTVSGKYTTGGTTSAAAATISVGGTPVIDTTHAGGTLVSLTVDGGTACTGADTIVNYPAGTLNIVTTTPQGLSTNIPVTVN